MDEADFLLDDTWVNGILPIWNVGTCALLTATTTNPKAGGVFKCMLPVKALMSKEDHDAMDESNNEVMDTNTTTLDVLNVEAERPFMRLLHFIMICDECRDANMTTLTCTHTTMLAPWANHDKREMTKQLLLKLDEGAFDREMSGSIAQASACFGRGHLHKLCKRITTELIPRAIGGRLRDYIFLAVDPAGGGKSDMAVAAIVARYSPSTRSDHLVIVGMDAYPVSKSDPASLVLAHIDGLRACDELRRLPIVLVIENNMSTIASQIYTQVCATCKRGGKRWAPIYALNEGSDARDPVGVLKTNKITTNMVEATRSALSNGSVYVWSRLVTVGENAIQQTHPTTYQLQKLVTQLSRFQRYKHTRADGTQSVMSINGKLRGTANDDLAVAVMWAVYGRKLFVGDPQVRLRAGVAVAGRKPTVLFHAATVTTGRRVAPRPKIRRRA